MMNRQEFTSILRAELSKLPPEEIDEAIDYFEECFDDATEGLDGESLAAAEEGLAKEFGNPKKIAKQIRADYAARLLGGEKPTADNKSGIGVLTAILWMVVGMCTAWFLLPLAAIVIAVIIAIYSTIGALFLASICSLWELITHLTAYTVMESVTGLGITLMSLSVSVVAAYGAFLATRAVVRKVASYIRRTNAERKARNAYSSTDDGDWAASVAEQADIERGE